MHALHGTALRPGQATWYKDSQALSTSSAVPSGAAAKGGCSLGSLLVAVLSRTVQTGFGLVTTSKSGVLPSNALATLANIVPHSVALHR